MVAGLSKRPNRAEMAVFAPWARWRSVDAKIAHFDREGYFSAWVKRFRWQPSRWNKEGYLPERPLVGAYAQDNASIGRYCDLYAFIASQLGLWHERNVYQSLGLFYANRELFNAVIEHG